jgi:vacuolar-type H+-ATPase catalytic subunit A/Vma1
MDKQYEMLKCILHFHKKGLEAIAGGADTENIFKLPVRADIAQAKYQSEKQMDSIIGIRRKIDEQFGAQVTGAKNA